MAQQTKSSARKTSPRSNAGPRGRTASARSKNGSGARGTSSRSASQRSNGSRSGGSRRTQSSRSSASSRQRAKDTGTSLGEIAAKAKVPALAAGAGLAGLAGGAVLAGRNSRKRVLGVSAPTKSGAQAVSKNLADAAKNVGSFGEGMGSLAAEVRRVREGVAEGGGDGRRSPIEVVLQALTRRR